MKYIYRVTILFLLCSCESLRDNFYGLEPQDLKQKDFNELKLDLSNVQTIEVQLPFDTDKHLKSSDMLDSCFSVRLQTTDDNLIGAIDEVNIYNDIIYVLDINKSKAVYTFDFNGTYLGRIGETGRGPGQYPRPEGLEIDEKNQEILISNASIRKIMRYDFKGKFLGDISPKIGNWDFKVLSNGHIVLLGGDQGNHHLGGLKNKMIYVINRNGDIISYGPPASSDYYNVKKSFPANLMVKNDEISYSYRLSDTIYTVYENRIEASYKLDFGKYNLDREEHKLKDTRAFNDAIKMGEESPAYFLGNHFQTKNWLAFKVSHNKKSIWNWYNKAQAKVLNGSIVITKTDDIFYLGSLVSSYQDYFVTALPSYVLEEIENQFQSRNESKTYNRSPILKNLGLSADFNIKNEDNPVLVFYKFKSEYNED